YSSTSWPAVPISATPNGSDLRGSTLSAANLAGHAEVPTSAFIVDGDSFLRLTLASVTALGRTRLSSPSKSNVPGSTRGVSSVIVQSFPPTESDGQGRRNRRGSPRP